MFVSAPNLRFRLDDGSVSIMSRATFILILPAMNWLDSNVPVLGLYFNPVSVSSPCVPVAPSTNTGNTVSLLVLFPEIVTVDASVAVAALPETLPEKEPLKLGQDKVFVEAVNLKSLSVVPKVIVPDAI